MATTFAFPEIYPYAISACSSAAGSYYLLGFNDINLLIMGGAAAGGMIVRKKMASNMMMMSLAPMFTTAAAALYIKGDITSAAIGGAIGYASIWLAEWGYSIISGTIQDLKHFQ